MNFSIIGAGKVGSAIGYKLIDQGDYELQSFCTRSRTSLHRASQYLGERGTLDVKEAAANSELLIISVPDHEIANVVQRIASLDLAGRYMFHVSGSLGDEILKEARLKGAVTGSIHPLQSFAGIEGAINNIEGTFFGVSGSDEGRRMALKIVNDIGGLPIEVEDNKKTLYHAAACIASNYLVTVFANAQKAAEEAGISPNDSLKPMVKLMASTLRNIEEYGPHQALTGPIARGSAQTVKDHLEALQAIPGLLHFYKMLGRETAKLSFETEKIGEAELDELNTFLEGG